MDGIKEYQYFADGKWLTAENRKLFDVFRPYDRGLYARVAAGGRAEAKLGWPPPPRLDSLKEFQDLIWINAHSGQRQYPI